MTQRPPMVIAAEDIAAVVHALALDKVAEGLATGEVEDSIVFA
jgi:hypothetical protein